MSETNSISLIDYLELFAHDKWSKHYALRTFPNAFSPVEFAELARCNGVRQNFIDAFINVHSLFKHYANHETWSSNNVCLEDCLLRLHIVCELTEGVLLPDYYTTLANPYNFSALDLALMSDDIELATALITNKPEFYQNYFSPVIELFLSELLTGLSLKKEGADFIAKFAELQGNPDAWIYEDNAATLTDSLLKNKETQEVALNKTNDPLFALLKPDATSETVFSDANVTRIAISHGNGFWSTGIWEAARFIMRNHPDVKIHLVDDKMFYTSLTHFDAWINPGAGDTYPTDKPFTLEEWTPIDGMEKLYQNALESTLDFNMPYLGFCAGSQHFALHHGGTVGLVEGYKGVKHNIHLSKSTLLYFMTLNKDQQNKALQNCDLPDISFKGDTAHSFAAFSDLLNAEEIRLSATYDNTSVAAGYEHINGLRFGTQFHPEHYYDASGRELNQYNILENFILLAKQYHQAKLGNAKFPHDTQPKILERLVDCVEQNAYYLNNPNDAAMCFANSTVADYCFA